MFQLVRDCSCKRCSRAQAAGRMPRNAPVRDCKRGPQCPCHESTCGGGGAREPCEKKASEPIDVNPMAWLKAGGILAAVAIVASVVSFVVEVLRSLVSWVSSHVGEILLTVAVLGGIAGLVWYLFFNSEKLLEKLQARLAERAERRRELKAARINALPSAKPGELPAAQPRQLPEAKPEQLKPVRVEVIRVTSNVSEKKCQK